MAKLVIIKEALVILSDAFLPSIDFGGFTDGAYRNNEFSGHLLKVAAVAEG